jgi:hypothetical protein
MDILVHHQSTHHSVCRGCSLYWSGLLKEGVNIVVMVVDTTRLAKAEKQLSEMIRRDRDKASIILWSVATRRRLPLPGSIL